MAAEYFLDYTAVLISAIVGAGLVLTAFIAAFLVAPRARTVRKDIPVECGIEPTGPSWAQMHIRYYLFGILFLIFAVEAVFLFPWAVIFLDRALGSMVFYEMLVFVGILFFGLIYGWKKGVLQWK
jgi:NADH-quinone oxidoreductase subunit A